MFIHYPCAKHFDRSPSADLDSSDNRPRASPLFHHYRGQIGSGEIVSNLQNRENTTISPSSVSGEIVVDLPLNSGEHNHHYLVVSRGD